MPDPVVTIRQLAACNNLTTSESNQIATSCTAAYRVSFGAAADENAAVAALRSYLEANNLQTFLGMQLESLSVTDRWTPTNYRVEARYEYNMKTFQDDDDEGQDPDEDKDPRPKDVSTASFSATEATRMVELSRVSSYGNMYTSPLLDLQQGSDGTLEAHGCPILVPSGTYSYTRHYKSSEMTKAVRKRIAGVRGKVNNASWKDWEKGSVLFLGETRERDRSTRWIRVTYNFQISFGDSSIPVGPYTVSKEGWEALTVRQVSVVVTLAGGQKLKQMAVAGAAVSQVYKYADFTDLPI